MTKDVPVRAHVFVESRNAEERALTSVLRLPTNVSSMTDTTRFAGSEDAQMRSTRCTRGSGRLRLPTACAHAQSTRQRTNSLSQTNSSRFACEGEDESE